MTIPLVVGVDGSEASLEAVDWAADEAVRHEVPLHLLHAARNHEASDVLGAASERARAGAPTVRLSSEVLHDDAASALVDKGRNAFALVLGSRGLGDLAGMLLGSVSLAVAARADCPVVVVRGAAEHRGAEFGSVVVGVEDGEGSGTAVQFAFREARARGCRLVAVHAWSTPLGAFTTPQAPPWYALETHRRPPAQVLDDALRGAAELCGDAPVSRRVIEGPARQALLEAASEADLLVVGARRRQGHLGLQLGLINHAVLHHAPCPVVVVPQV
ncbi:MULTISPECIES: universal stress protein [unclassified Streptomyces]|uniref:universal stress protein n=1 Tax=unclassified Streptomyces TaxID=2593676 RepID=UPI002365194F|nr:MULTISPECIES: universal stress protein [unclassified Streptomyces]MDF3143651.1 universal stress protein [Streptomyces sp. T21Q-yed]WDF43883.1 universal stress protein [Streptomyces sp. T12]